MDIKDIAKRLENCKGVCEIAEVTMFRFEDKMNYLVYLTESPCNDDQIVFENHDYVYTSIVEFLTDLNGEDDVELDQMEVISITPFTSDFVEQKKEDEFDDVQWYKVRCSLFNWDFGIIKWIDLVELMSCFKGYDYTIKGMKTKLYKGVDSYYADGKFYKIS